MYAPARSQRSIHHGRFTNKTIEVTTPTLSLEALHQLAQRRAEERKTNKPSHKEENARECPDLSENSRETFGTKHKGKRKRHDVDESRDSHVNKAQEGIKQICLQEERSGKETPKKKPKGKRKNDDEVSPSNSEHTTKLKETLPAIVGKPASRSTLSSEESGDSDGSSVDSASERMADVKEVVNDPELPSATRINGAEAQDEGMNPVVADSKYEKSVSDESALGLEPLTHKQQHSQSNVGKSLVQRILPSWILHSEIIEEDIKSCSKPVSNFLLPNTLVKNLSKVGVAQLFPVQAHVIPELLSSNHGPLLTSRGGATPRDVCVCAPTGCGKTLCYVLPIVSALLNRVVCQVRAIVIVPSQELAIQVQQVFKSMVHGTGLKTGIICGGSGLKTGIKSSQTSLENEREMLFDRFSHPPASCVDIVIATPGRLVEHINKSSFATLSLLRYLVVDEADKLLDQTFSQWLPKLLVAIAADKNQIVVKDQRSLENTLIDLCGDVDRLKLLQLMDSRLQYKDGHPQVPSSNDSQSVNPDHSFVTSSPPLSRNSTPLQKLLFSATMSYNPEHLAALSLHQPKLFTIESALLSKDADTTYTLPQQLEEAVVNCSLEEKPLVLLHLVTSSLSNLGEEERENRVLCFTNSRESTHRLFLLLQSFGVVSVAEMSGAVSQGRRKEVLTNFKKGKTQVLICSDQMARGMDVEEVSCVVSYEPPRKFQTYLHRAGRTARAGQRGVVYTLLARDEVHPFHTMLRQVSSKRKLEEKILTPDDLKPFREQYPAALEELRSKLT